MIRLLAACLLTVLAAAPAAAGSAAAGSAGKTAALTDDPMPALADLVAEAVRAERTDLPPEALVEAHILSRGTREARSIRGFVFDGRSFRFRGIAQLDRRAERFHGQATISVPAVVPARDIRRGETLTPADLRLEDFPIRRLHPEALRSVEAAAGQVARRVLRAGDAIAANALEPQALVERNRPVRLVYESGTLRVRGKGKALEDAGEGEFVRVVNLQSGKVVTGLVTGPGEVSFTY